VIEVWVSVIPRSIGKQEDGYVRYLILKIIMSHQSASKAIIVQDIKNILGQRENSVSGKVSWGIGDRVFLTT
jgi:hypothetical protein